jgi:hypothetical protein
MMAIPLGNFKSIVVNVAPELSVSMLEEDLIRTMKRERVENALNRLDL